MSRKARGLAANDVIRVILANRASGLFHSIEELFSSVARCFPMWVTSSVVRAPRSRASLSSLFANLRWARSLKDCDLIHQTGDIHYTVLAMWRCPVVLTIHDLRFIDETRGGKRWLFWWGWLYLPCLRANRVTVISEFTKSRLSAMCRLSPSKVRVIPNCVAPEFKPFPKRWGEPQVRILLVGTTPNKNLERITEACRGLSIRCSVLGRLSGEQKTEFETSNLEYEERFDLTREEVVKLYQSCDLLVFVSTYEGFGMPILEAQAVGRPVLTSDISPMREVAGDGALKVDPFDVSAIREGLTRLLGDAELREQLVEAGFRNVAKYSADSVAAQYAALYREVLENR
jgi:glycosyltransferase involved in cell wall biosynthesis